MSAPETHNSLWSSANEFGAVWLRSAINSIEKGVTIRARCDDCNVPFPIALLDHTLVKRTCRPHFVALSALATFQMSHLLLLSQFNVNAKTDRSEHQNLGLRLDT